MRNPSAISPAPLPTWPSYEEGEIEAVARVLRGGKVNYWTGNECREFEREYAEWTESDYAVALGNGTQALELALNALEIGAGDEVVVTPRTFIASVSSIVLAGAVPVFADVDRDSQNITADSIRAVLTPKTRAIMCVHLAGWPCDMDPIMALARDNKLVVVEDCAQAHGARYKGRPVGSIGNIGAWSFCQDKVMTTGGEGGMVTTNDKELWSRVWSFKDHGKSWQAVYEQSHPPGYRWVHESFGTNMRMLELQAAIGRVQLVRMAGWHQRRMENADRLMEAFASCRALRVPRPPDHVEHAWYKLYAFVIPELLKANWNRERILSELSEVGVPCYSGSCPEVYLEKAFDSRLRPVKRLANARELGETSLMFLVHPTLGNREIDRVGEAVIDVMARATR